MLDNVNFSARRTQSLTNALAAAALLLLPAAALLQRMDRVGRIQASAPAPAPSPAPAAATFRFEASVEVQDCQQRKHWIDTEYASIE